MRVSNHHASLTRGGCLHSCMQQLHTSLEDSTAKTNDAAQMTMLRSAFTQPRSPLAAGITPELPGCIQFLVFA
jgi:hypothetical protein